MASAVEAVRSHPWVKGTYEVVVDLVREWRDDRVNGLAAEVAFFAILSIFPGLLAVPWRRATRSSWCWAARSSCWCGSTS